MRGSRSESKSGSGSENKQKRPVPLKRVTIGKRELHPEKPVHPEVAGDSRHPRRSRDIVEVPTTCRCTREKPEVRIGPEIRVCPIDCESSPL